MAIDWNDNEKRKAFRKALQQVYTTEAKLAMFVNEELNENLEVLAGGDDLQGIAFNLIKWAYEKPGKLDEVYKAFKKENPENPLITELERQSFVPQSSNLTQYNWDTLFGLVLPDDLADLRRAFKRGFKEAIGIDFQVARPNYPPISALAHIRELLENYDGGEKGPLLAVRFVEFAIAELQRSSEGHPRDLTDLQRWRDAIAQQYNIRSKPPKPTVNMTSHAYLLVAIEEIGADVNVYPELHIDGAENPVSFDAKPTTCPIHQVADHISQWIKQAEEIKAIQQCKKEEEVILELFLPCRYLEEDVAMTWTVKDKREREIPLGTHRRFLIRSLDRVRDRQIQKALQWKWQCLEEFVKENNVGNNFRLQEHCPEGKGTLRALLQDNNAIGLKLIDRLPEDRDKRRDLLYDIIDAAIPIALWSSMMAEVDTTTLRTEFDRLLEHNQLTNFASFASHWRSRRLEFKSAQSIRLLCDRPDRLPRLPDPAQEEDLLVAS